MSDVSLSLKIAFSSHLKQIALLIERELCYFKVQPIEVNSSADDFPNILSHLNAQHSDIFLVDAINVPYPLPQTMAVAAIIKQPISNHNPSINDYVAVLALKNQTAFLPFFKNIDERKDWGDVILAGFGPGDSGLITRRTEQEMTQADIIFHDDLIDEDYLSKFKAELVYVGKRKGQHSHVQADINQLLYQAAITGKRVVRIKGGDPLIFGRGAEEFHYLQKRFIKAAIIPGISSALAAAASIQVPLTARGISSSVVFLSAHDLMKLNIPKADTLVFFMGATRQGELAQHLIDNGWHAHTPVAVVKSVSQPDTESRRYTLIEMVNDANPLGGPAIIIVGYVAAFNPDEQPPRWLYTGIHIDNFNEHGIPVHSPMNEILPIAMTDELRQTLNNVSQFNRIIFTSRYAVQSFFDRLFDADLDVRDLGKIKITSIGKNTSAELKTKGIIAHPANENDTLDGLIDTFTDNKIVDESILIPCSTESRSKLGAKLEQLGNKVKRLPVFISAMPDHIIRHNLEEFTGIIFTSPASVDHFFKFYGELSPHLIVKVKGSQTGIRLSKYQSEINFDVI